MDSRPGFGWKEVKPEICHVGLATVLHRAAAQICSVSYSGVQLFRSQFTHLSLRVSAPSSPGTAVHGFSDSFSNMGSTAHFGIQELILLVSQKVSKL